MQYAMPVLVEAHPPHPTHTHSSNTHPISFPFQVVAAELNLEGGREYVTYKIRVSDGTDGPQWTVARRFRNFEELHRVLRGNPAYKLKLPPKKVFFHNQVRPLCFGGCVWRGCRFDVYVVHDKVPFLHLVLV